MINDTGLKHLEEFGFTSFEALIYLELLGKSPQTGYALAKNIKRTRSSTYLVLNQMETKGYIRKLEGIKGKQYIAVQIEEIIDKREQALERQKATLIKTLQDVSSDDEDDYIYKLNDSEEFFSESQQYDREGRQFHTH